MRNKNIYIILLALIFSISLGIFVFIRNGPKFKSNKTCHHCNILLVDIDTLGAKELPCYGYGRNTTPNICNFAKKSVLFKNNYSTYFWTLPSIFSTVTSLYPTFHRVFTPYTDSLSTDKTTLVKTLKNQGYQTIYVGPNNNTSALTRENGGLLGYDVITTDPIEKVISKYSKSLKPWFIHYYLEDLHLPYLIPENTSPFENLTRPKSLPLTQNEFLPILNLYIKKHPTEVFQKNALEKFSSIIFSESKPDDVSAAQLFYKLYSQQYSDLSQEKYLINVWKPIYNAYMETFDQKNPSDLAFLRMMYDTQVNQIDKKLFPLFEKLNSWPFSKNTVTVINSDHGEAFGEFGTFGHEGNFHSESFHTPLIIYSPKFPAATVEQSSSNIDIFPTLMDLVGIKIPSDLQGLSLFPALNGQLDNSSSRFVFSISPTGLTLQNKYWLYYLPSNSTNVNQSILYNKTTDPNEKTNVSSKYPELTSSLYKQAHILFSYEKSLSNTDPLPNFDLLKIDPEKLERLKKEGYF